MCETSKPMAILFYELCAGETSGHMAMIPNNPTLYGLCRAHGVVTQKDFAEMLKAIANELLE